MTAPSKLHIGDTGIVAPTPLPALVFYSYAPEDSSLYYQLEEHLSLLHRQVEFWHQGKAFAGTDTDQAASKYLNEAAVLVLLVSSSYLSSDRLYREQLRAMERHHADQARVVPIIVRPCDWEFAEFASLTPLPAGGTPVTSWSNRDEAWTNVARGLRAIALPGLDRFGQRG